ncbi:MAG: TrmH family RNA methyltransferase [Opitutales bacterium]
MPFQEIQSRQNPRIQAAARLARRRRRDREGRFLIEGLRELAHARAGAPEIETVFACPAHFPSDGHHAFWDAWCAAAEYPERAVRCPAPVFERLTGRQGPDGLIGLARWEPPDGRRLLRKLSGAATVLVVDGVEKPGNLGAMLRTADGAGVAAVLATGPGTDLINPQVIRSSQGLVFRVPVASMDRAGARSALEAVGCRMMILTPEADQPYWAVDLTGRTALVVGSEAEGLDPFWRGSGLAGITIPMRGRADSLNVATSAALVLYEALRQRTV